MDKEHIKFIMTALTLIDVIILILFITILSEHQQVPKSNIIVARQLEELSNSPGIGSDNNSEIVQSEIVEKEDDTGNVNDSLIFYYNDKLLGYHVASNNMVYQFQQGNKYSGFFDSSNTNLIGGSYSLTINRNNEPTLYIYNAGKTSRVEYTMSKNSQQNIVLHHKTSGSNIELK